jgi:nucleoside-diphosphate-sugar epimerase
MKIGLIGHTGFVGGNLARQYPIDEGFDVTNIGTIAGREFDLLFCAGAPAVKYVANAKPDEDIAAIRGLFKNLSSCSAKKVVLISTVDVYQTPTGVDEGTPIDLDATQPYGKHRRRLEQMVEGWFDEVHVVRLPALFGQGLKKNVVYDFLHDNQVDKINPRGSFQWYSLNNLKKDIDTAIAHKLRYLNISVEPVTVTEVAKHAFGFDFENPAITAPGASYDFKSRHAALFGGQNGYLYSREQSLAALKQFVAEEKARIAAA